MIETKRIRLRGGSGNGKREVRKGKGQRERVRGEAREGE